MREIKVGTNRHVLKGFANPKLVFGEVVDKVERSGGSIMAYIVLAAGRRFAAKPEDFACECKEACYPV